MEKELGDSLAKKFGDDGVIYKGKLIGIDPVTGPRGDKMCHSAMQRLKAIAKGKGSHKEKIVISISLDGIKLTNEKSNEVISHQRIPLISYISRDTSDSRAFGYVCGSPETGHQFVAIKTEKSAIPVMKTIGELFKYVYEKKKQEKNENEERNMLQDADHPAGLLSTSSRSNSQDFSGTLTSSSKTASAKTSPTPSSATERYAKWEDFHDEWSEKPDVSTTTTTTKKSSSSQSKSLFPLLPMPSSPKRKHTRKLGVNAPPAEPKAEVSPAPNFADFFSSDFSDFTTFVTTPASSFSVPAASVSTIDTTEKKQEDKKKQNTFSNGQQSSDRYAAFSEIHSMPSVFETIINQSNDSPKNTGSVDEPYMAVDNGLSADLLSSPFETSFSPLTPLRTSPLPAENWTLPLSPGPPKPSRLHEGGSVGGILSSMNETSTPVEAPISKHNGTHSFENFFQETPSNGPSLAANPSNAKSLENLFSDNSLFESFVKMNAESNNRIKV